MTISSETNRNDYVGNGTVDTYSYTFRILQNSDLLVTVADTNGSESTLTITTDYTVTGAGDSGGGTVVLVNNSQSWLDSDGDLKSNYALTIRRVLPLTQPTDIRNQGDFYGETHEDQFDRLVFIDQQQQDELDRSVKFAETSTQTNVTFPEPVANTVIAWNSAGTALTASSIASGGTAVETTGDQSIAGDKTFVDEIISTPSSAAVGITINQAQAADGIDINHTGNGDALNIDKTAGTGSAIDVGAGNFTVQQSGAVSAGVGTFTVGATGNTAVGGTLTVTGLTTHTIEQTMTQISTPSTPSSGTDKFYPKSDGFLRSLDSSGNERIVGYKYAIVSYQTGGGGDTSQTSLSKLSLNTEVDPFSIVTLSSSVITLGAGTYLIEGWMSTAQGAGDTQCILRNTSDGTTAIIGGVGDSANAATIDDNVTINICGIVTIAASKNFEFQAISDASVAGGWGNDPGFATDNVYTLLKIVQIA